MAERKPTARNRESAPPAPTGQEERIDLDNPEFKKVWDLLLHTTRSVFLTGKAVTGKSKYMSYIKENHPKQMVVHA
ncbi:MAG: hypothetical protein K2F68_04010, partial [Duncaniella sp.]|nr:hypothetical protein [Duncaniella sp.]